MIIRKSNFKHSEYYISMFGWGLSFGTCPRTWLGACGLVIVGCTMALVIPPLALWRLVRREK